MRLGNIGYELRRLTKIWQCTNVKDNNLRFMNIRNMEYQFMKSI